MQLAIVSTGVLRGGDSSQGQPCYPGVSGEPPMSNQRYDLLAFSLLAISVTFTAWVGISGPIRFADLQPWQPLIAAVIALGAAMLAYHAGMKNYRAAMA